ncbi:hypothetical protein ACOMHN_033112 [Nucella lapillus]
MLGKQTMLRLQEVTNQEGPCTAAAGDMMMTVSRDHTGQEVRGRVGQRRPLLCHVTDEGCPSVREKEEVEW